MKPNYAFFIVLFLTTSVWAQKSVSTKTKAGGTRLPFAVNVLSNPQQGTASLGGGSCDTVNYPVPSDWKITGYYSHDIDNNITGFMTGVNVSGDKEKAAFFDMSQSGDKYITKVWIAFAAANSNKSASLSKIVPIHIYDGTSGKPGTVLTTVNKTLSDLKADVSAKRYTEVNFATSVVLPASKKFFVSVDLTNLTWGTEQDAEQDTLGIYSSDPVFYTPESGENGFGWENAEDDWQPMGNDWLEDFNLVILPIVCTDAILPIHLLSFTASRQGNANVVNWTTATESGNAGFTLQRSSDGVGFTNLARINSKAQGGNSSTPLTYSYNDSKGISANNYYRLVQTDINGNESYSSIVNVKSATPQTLQIANVWPSPATSYIKLLLFSPSNEKIQVTVVDLTGKVVSQKTEQLSTGDNTVVLNINSLTPGTYFIKAGNSNSSSAISKFVKE